MKGRPSKQHFSVSRQIWVDAQACSATLLSNLFEIAERRRSVLTLVAHRSVPGPDSAFIRGIVLNPEFQTVAARITSALQSGDLLLTADAELSKTAVSRGARVFDPRDTRNTTAQLDQLLTPRPLPVASRPAADDADL